MEAAMNQGNFLEPVGAGNDASSSSSSSRNPGQSKSDALEGLHLPSPPVPTRVNPNDPYFVFVMTNSKTFELAHGSKNQDKKAVVHSLRLHQEHKIKNSHPEKPIYDVKLDKVYAERIQNIAPGLSYDEDLEFRKDQYEKHGYLTNLGQVEYFEDIIILYEHFNQSLPVARHINALNQVTTVGRRDYHKDVKWNVLDMESVANHFCQKFRVYVGLTYIKDKNDVKYLYEYKFYFNKDFKMVNAPDSERRKILVYKNLIPEFKSKKSGHKKSEFTDDDLGNKEICL